MKIDLPGAFNSHIFMNLEKAKSLLSTTVPFRGLPSSEIDRLISMGHLVQLKKNENAFSEGDEATNVWILLSGRIEVYKYTSEGKPCAIEVILPKDLFGTLCRLGGNNRTYPCTTVACTDSEALQIPDSLFFEIFHKYPVVVSGVCALCSGRLNLMQELACASQEPVEKRIIRTLFQLAKKHGLTLPYTKKQIGELSSTTVESTIRTLSKFQKNKWIASSRGQIFLKNAAELEALIKS